MDGMAGTDMYWAGDSYSILLYAMADAEEVTMACLCLLPADCLRRVS